MVNRGLKKIFLVSCYICTSTCMHQICTCICTFWYIRTCSTCSVRSYSYNAYMYNYYSMCMACIAPIPVLVYSQSPVTPVSLVGHDA